MQKITYMLIMRLKRSQKIRIGALGLISFKKGEYVYVGSAPKYGNKIPRIERHLRSKKSIKWHIDYLLQKAEIIEVNFSLLSECAAAKKLVKSAEPVNGFGCSDCGCTAHLFKI